MPLRLGSEILQSGIDIENNGWYFFAYTYAIQITGACECEVGVDGRLDLISSSSAKVAARAINAWTGFSVSPRMVLGLISCYLTAKGALPATARRSRCPRPAIRDLVWIFYSSDFSHK
jgi:hypothetical protein